MAPRGKTFRSGQLAGELMLAPLVIGMRLPLMMRELHASKGRPGAETSRAVTEKAISVVQGAAAAQLAMANAALLFWPQLMSGKTPALLSGAAAEQALQAALKPAGRKVKSNFQRLSRRKP